MNAINPASVFYGLHMVEGVAEYREKDEPYRILVREEALKQMDATFVGRPVFVGHRDDFTQDDIEKIADGYVVESFFNKADGKHWAKFIITTDKGHEAIRKGWRLSNAYRLKDVAGGGTWHMVDYLKEVMRGEYDHLAIVPDPRYDESIVLTPEQFKEYNNKKEVELERLANSKGENVMFFTKEKVKNSKDLEVMSVELPKSKKTVELMTIINEADEKELKKDEPVFANGEHKVKVGDGEMSVNELVEKYNSMCAKNQEDDDSTLEDQKAKNEAEEEEKKKNAEEAKKKEEEEKAKNEAEAKKKAEGEKAKNAKSADNFNKIANAEKNANEKVQNSARLDMMEDQIARGKSRYGSSK